MQSWRTVRRFLKKVKIERLCHLAILLLGIYPEKTLIQRDTCTPVLTVALFTIAKTWKWPQCPSTEEWIKTEFELWSQSPFCWSRLTVCGDKGHVVYLYNRILLSPKREWNNAICSNTNGPRECHIKWIKSQKDKYHIILLMKWKWESLGCVRLFATPWTIQSMAFSRPEY